MLAKAVMGAGMAFILANSPFASVSYFVWETTKNYTSKTFLCPVYEHKDSFPA